MSFKTICEAVHVLQLNLMKRKFVLQNYGQIIFKINYRIDAELKKTIEV